MATRPYFMLCGEATPRLTAERVVNILLIRGADINKGDATGYTPLMSAAYVGDLPMILYLIKNGADINAETKY